MQNINQKNLILMMGIPGSGKSTLAQSLKNYLENQQNLIIIEADALYNLDDSQIQYFIDNTQSIQMNNEEDYKFNQQKFIKDRSNLPKIIEKYILKLENVLTHYTIILDDNNLLKDVRKKFKIICRKYQLGYCIIQLDIPIKICKLRCQNRKKKIDYNILENDRKNIQDNDEYIIKLTKNSKQQDLVDNIIKTCSQSLQQFKNFHLKQIENIQEVNIKEQLDTKLKKEVNDYIKKNSKVVQNKEIMNSILLSRKQYFNKYKNKIQTQQQLQEIIKEFLDEINKNKNLF